MYTCMRLTTPDGRFATANFFLTFSIFCKHTSKFTCDAIFSVPDTCEQQNINVKVWKIYCCKSAVGCRKPHTCVRTLSCVVFNCLTFLKLSVTVQLSPCFFSSCFQFFHLVLFGCLKSVFLFVHFLLELIIEQML